MKKGLNLRLLKLLRCPGLLKARLGQQGPDHPKNVKLSGSQMEEGTRKKTVIELDDKLTVRTLRFQIFTTNSGKYPS